MVLSVFLLDYFSLSSLYFIHLETRFQTHGTTHSQYYLTYVLGLIFLTINPWPHFDHVISTFGFSALILSQIICILSSLHYTELKIYWIIIFNLFWD